jgi:hypothetical protein
MRPDGAKITFVRFNLSRVTDVYTMKAHGTNQRVQEEVLAADHTRGLTPLPSSAIS